VFYRVFTTFCLKMFKRFLSKQNVFQLWPRHRCWHRCRWSREGLLPEPSHKILDLFKRRKCINSFVEKLVCIKRSITLENGTQPTLPVCPSACLSACLPACCLSENLSVSIFVCLSDHLSVFLSACLTICPSCWTICQSLVCLFSCMFVFLSVWSSVSLSVCLSVYMSQLLPCQYNTVFKPTGV
jgi:hypothetical protein